MTYEAFPKQRQSLSPGSRQGLVTVARPQCSRLVLFPLGATVAFNEGGQDMQGPTLGAPRRRVRLDDLRPERLSPVGRIVGEQTGDKLALACQYRRPARLDHGSHLGVFSGVKVGAAAPPGDAAALQ